MKVVIIFLSEVAKLVLILADEFDLLGRHLILRIFSHNAMAHGLAIWLSHIHSAGASSASCWIDQERLLLLLLLLGDRRFIGSL